MQVSLHVRPLVREHAVHHRIAHRAVTSGPVVADDSVSLRAQTLDGSLRSEIQTMRDKVEKIHAKIVQPANNEQGVLNQK